MIADDPNFLDAVRKRFQNVGNCPISGDRIFFENAGRRSGGGPSAAQVPKIVFFFF